MESICFVNLVFVLIFLRSGGIVCDMTSVDCICSKSDKPLYFLDCSKRDLEALFDEFGLPRWRVGQVRRWVFARKKDSFDQMTDLSKELRSELARRFTINANGSLFAGKLVTHRVSDDGTIKILVEFPDGHRVESVLLRDERNHRTACISTQVGCAMGCLFCASGLDGFVRNLTRGEILEQILRLNMLLPEAERLTHLVIMGTGEPMLNRDNLLSALEDATDCEGLDLSNRRVTVSTVGLPEGIEAMAAANVPYKLAISLHAPNDALRNRIMPSNRRTGIARILSAADVYFQKSGRRVTFEYILIDQCNSSEDHARELAAVLRGRTAIVNLIPYNPVEELVYRTPSNETVRRFADILTRGGIQVKVRFRKGDQIDAACGQLRRSCSTE